MTSSSLALPLRAPAALARHPLVERYAPLATTVLALIAIWYIAAVAMNWRLVRDGFEREEVPYSITEVISGTMQAERPLLPAPHQIVLAFLDSVFGYPPLAPRSLVYHSLVTLSAMPIAGHTFDGWSGGGCSGTGSCNVSVSKNVTVTARFTVLTLKVTRSGTGRGRVMSSPPGIDCPTDCSEAYTRGTMVTLTATPDETRNDA